jgi:tRNA pseudouridine55 synthase
VSGPHGVLVADKPAGPTSHGVVQQARRLYSSRAVGHAGTLDPMATGVLLLLFGEGLKLSPYLTAAYKRYRATVAFGRTTDTLDALGKTTHESALAPGWLDAAALETALDLERARTTQVPPSYSAIRLAGERAHRLSRQGAAPELAPRDVRVEALKLVGIANNSTGVDLDLIVSKGYYVRALARDLGQALGVPAHLAALRRVASGAFTLDDAVVWPPSAPAPLMDLETAAARTLPLVQLNAAGERRARFGQALSVDDFTEDPVAAHGGHEHAGVVGWIGTAGQLVALGRYRADRGYCVVRGFALRSGEPE